MGKRLFIAADIDEATRGQIAAISGTVRDAIGGDVKASWVRPDRMHLTLQFFGDAPPPLEQRLSGLLTDPIREKPFDLSFAALGVFPDRGSPRVLWLGLDRGMRELSRIEHYLGERLNLARERGQFTPHLTLARFRDRIPRGRIAEILDIPALAGPTRIDRVTLYESRLSPAGPTYLRLAEAPLQL